MSRWPSNDDDDSRQQHERCESCEGRWRTRVGTRQSRIAASKVIRRISSLLCLFVWLFCVLSVSSLFLRRSIDRMLQCFSVTDNIAHIVVSQSSLRSLSLSWCLGLDDRALSTLARCCRALVDIALVRCPQVNAKKRTRKRQRKRRIETAYSSSDYLPHITDLIERRSFARSRAVSIERRRIEQRRHVRQ
jgi:hypothetical protein